MLASLAGRDRLQPLVQCRWNSSGAPLVRALWQGGAVGGSNESPREDTTGPGLELVEVPVPAVGQGDVLVKVKATGICGTDLHIDSWDEWAQRTLQPPVTVGHEFSGEWFRSAPASPTLRLAIWSAARLTWSAAGAATVAPAGAICAFTPEPSASTSTVPSPNTSRCPPATPGCTAIRSIQVAAIFDPFGNAVHTALAFPMLGEDVLVTGAGPIGIMAGW